MRNRKVQRKIKKYLSNGGAKENIHFVREEKLNRTSEFSSKDGPISDVTPYQAIKPGLRLVIRKGNII